MKKLLTVCLLMAATFTVKAQEMSFEETVKYINGKLACCSDKNFSIEVNLAGDIKWKDRGDGSDKRINLFDLVNVDTSKYTILSSNGISLRKYSKMKPWDCRGISFEISTDNSNLLALFDVQADAERVYKALQHLRNLCTKEKDPFDK